MSIHYERRGSGTPLVLLHGVGHRRQAWDPVLGLLAAHHDVVALDLPGFGRSPLEEAYDVAGAVRRLARFFGELGLGRPHVAGNSLGGLLSLELAAEGHVASATALSPAGMWTLPQRTYSLSVMALARLLARTPAPIARWSLQAPLRRRLVWGLMFGRTERLFPDEVLADMDAFRRAEGFWPAFNQGWRYAFQSRPMSVPVTIAWGGKDHVLPQGQARRARRLVPDARWVDLPGLGHVPMNDDPEVVAGVILQTTGAVT